MTIIQNNLVTFQKFSPTRKFPHYWHLHLKSLGLASLKHPTLKQGGFQLPGLFSVTTFSVSISPYHQVPLSHLGWSQLSSSVFSCLSRYQGSSLPWDLSFLMSPRKAIDFSVCSAFPSQKDQNENVRARNKSSLDLFLNDETILHFKDKAFLIMMYYYFVYCRIRFAKACLIKFAFIFTTDTDCGFLFVKYPPLLLVLWVLPLSLLSSSVLGNSWYRFLYQLFLKCLLNSLVNNLNPVVFSHKFRYCHRYMCI